MSEAAIKKTLEIECGVQEYNFRSATTLESVMEACLSDIGEHRFYQHYTTLETAIYKICKKRWYLSRMDNLKLNDWREAKAFGKYTDAANRTYIACFGQGLRESAAMWGLYGKGSPLAVRIKIPASALHRWMSEIELTEDNRATSSAVEAMDAKEASNDNVAIGGNLKYSTFRDIVYASVKDEDVPEGFKTNRSNALFWRGIPWYCTQEETDDFCSFLSGGSYTGFVKDAEWQYENESRLRIELNREIDAKAIHIKIPNYVLESMSFTFSPWGDVKTNKMVETVLNAILEGTCDNYDTKKPNRFSASILQGALNFTR